MALADRPGAPVHAVAEEVEFAGMREARIGHQAQMHRELAGNRSRLGCAGIGYKAEIGGFVDVEIDVERVGRDNRGEERRSACIAAGDEIAFCDENPVDAPCNRCGDAGEGEIEFGGRDGNLGDVDLRLALTPHGLRVIESLAWRVAFRSQRFGAPEVDLGLIVQNVCLLQLCLGRVQGHFERSRIDLEEKLAGPHETAFGNADGDDRAADARTQLDSFGRFQMTGKLNGRRDLARDDLGNRHLRNRHLCRLRDSLRGSGRGSKRQNAFGVGSDLVAIDGGKRATGDDGAGQE